MLASRCLGKMFSCFANSGLSFSPFFWFWTGLKTRFPFVVPNQFFHIWFDKCHIKILLLLVLIIYKSQRMTWIIYTCMYIYVYVHICVCMVIHTDIYLYIYILFLFFLLFFFFFLAALGLHCWARAFSSYGEWGATLRCGAWASHCGGFSCCGAWAVGAQASVAVARGLSSCGSWALERRLSSRGTLA